LPRIAPDLGHFFTCCSEISADAWGTGAARGAVAR